MKKILLFLLALPLATSAQDLASLKTETQKMIDVSMKVDVDAILDMTYPKIFDIAPREQMKIFITQAFTPNEQFSMKLLPVAPNLEYGPVKKIGEHTFSLVHYDMGLEMAFKQDLGDPELVKNMMKEQMGAAKVEYDKEKNAFVIAKRSLLIAVADAATQNQWKFINYENSGEQLFDTLFSADIRKQLGL